MLCGVFAGGVIIYNYTAMHGVDFKRTVTIRMRPVNPCWRDRQRPEDEPIQPYEVNRKDYTI